MDAIVSVVVVKRDCLSFDEVFSQYPSVLLVGVDARGPVTA